MRVLNKMSEEQLDFCLSTIFFKSKEKTGKSIQGRLYMK